MGILVILKSLHASSPAARICLFWKILFQLCTWIIEWVIWLSECMFLETFSCCLSRPVVLELLKRQCPIFKTNKSDRFTWLMEVEKTKKQPVLRLLTNGNVVGPCRRKAYTIRIDIHRLQVAMLGTVTIIQFQV